ncbi:MAG: hypothetical protein H7240_06655 [Glaciimonas sp.]|nr:hypothetical protein [Glaciimonas sp.]
MFAFLALFLFMAASVKAQSAYAGDMLVVIKQRGNVVVGVAYAGQGYAAGQKFRTPENVDDVLAEALAKRLNVSVSTVLVTPHNRLQLLPEKLIACCAGFRH